MMEQSTSRRTVLQDLHLPVQNAPATRNGQEPGALDPAKGVHAGLWLDRYLTNGDVKPNASQRKQEQSRQTLVREVANLEVPALYTTFYQRWLQMLGEAGATSPRYRREFEVKGRMAVGLGNESVLETSVALHHTYGVPYIPGSALKGLAASYARLMAGEGWLPESPAYKAVFGDTENAGYIIFFDALYVPKSASPVPAMPGDHPLRADIITVHHPNYYRGPNAHGKIDPPADWDSPNPVPFLSATGKYLIALAAPDLDEKQGYRDIWIEKVFEILTEALLVMGIGAKTSSGYGRMKYVSPFSSEAEKIMSDIERMPYIEINQKIQRFYEIWQKLTRQEDRLGVAQAIIDKVRANGYEAKKVKLPWYQELLAFVE